MLAVSTCGVLAQETPAAPPAADPAPAPAEGAAATTPAALPDATLEQRVFDLETYFNNVAPGVDGDKKWNTKIAVAGPGHNGFMPPEARC